MAQISSFPLIPPETVIQMCSQMSPESFLNNIARLDLPANIYLFEFNNRNTRKSCKVCSKLTIKTLERRQCFYF